MVRNGIVALGIAVASLPTFAQVDVPAELEALRQPRIVERAPQRMLVVQAQGDPRTVGSRAFGLLFQLYYAMPGTPKGPAQPAPRARWPIGFDQPRTEWVGYYALPVPDTVTAVPDHEAPPGLVASVETWTYGPCAEILHVGPYDQEEPTIRELHALAGAEGYEVTGVHEEEYIRGPTMSGPGDPEAYLTILRYGVTPAGDRP